VIGHKPGKPEDRSTKPHFPAENQDQRAPDNDGSELIIGARFSLSRADIPGSEACSIPVAASRAQLWHAGTG